MQVKGADKVERMHPLKPFYDVIDTGEPREKMEKMPSFPRIIELEITNHCNFQCIMCKTGNGQAKRERGYMSEEVYDKLINELSGKNTAIKFVGQGESTLHPSFLEWVKKAKEKGIVCHLTTNGSMFHEQYMNAVIESGIDSVKFSFQGVTSEGYKMLRIKDDFDVLLEKIKKLYELRGEKINPFITIGTSVLMETQEEIENFKKQCIPFCDKLEVGVTTLEFVNLDFIADLENRKKMQEIQQSQKKALRRYKCCHQVFDVITLHWNGNICACCADNDEVMVLGNIHNMTINECWNCEKENYYRKLLLDRRYEALPLCKDCFDVYGWTYNENK